MDEVISPPTFPKEYMENNISLENLSIGYPSHIVAEGISASLLSGQLTCLLGSNGAGKSTLLRTLGGFLPALSGNMVFHLPEGDYELNAMTPKERAKMIGVVLTERTELHDMTARELVGMGRTPYTGFWGKLSEEDNNIVEKAIEMVGIGNLAHRMVQTLSDGERQKVMIAKALAQQTPIILLDEPTAFLDYPSKVETLQLLRSLCNNTGKIVFLSTHDIEIALQLADNLWLMNNGKISVGSPRQLADSGDISNFIERPDVHFCTEDLTIKVR